MTAQTQTADTNTVTASEPKQRGKSAQVPASQRSSAPVNTLEAVDRISAVLDPKPKKEKPVKVSKDSFVKAEAVVDADPLSTEPAEESDPLLSPDSDSDQGDVQTTEEGDPVDGDEATTDESASDENKEPETLHTIVVDGKESKVSYEELISGYQRQSDYTRKMQDLTKQRKDLQSVQEQVKDLPTVQKTYQENAERFAKNGQLIMLALEQRFMPQEPDKSLLDTNPGAYMKQKEMFQEALHFRSGIQQELETLNAQKQQEQVRTIQAGRQKLFEVMPEMKEAANRQKLKAYVNSLGISDEAIAAEPNHVLFVMAEKARKYDEIMQRKAEITTDNAKPKVAKQTKAADGHKALQVRKRTETIEQHKSNKSVDSAARAIAGLGLV